MDTNLEIVGWTRYYIEYHYNEPPAITYYTVAGKVNEIEAPASGYIAYGEDGDVIVNPNFDLYYNMTLLVPAVRSQQPFTSMPNADLVINLIAGIETLSQAKVALTLIAQCMAYAYGAQHYVGVPEVYMPERLRNHLLMLQEAQDLENNPPVPEDNPTP